MNARLLLTASLAAGLVACGSMPDLKRGRAALEAGDDVAAESDLRPLAERGYRDARLKLARIYADRESPDEMAAAADWYRELMQDDPTLDTQLARVLIRMGGQQNLKEAEYLLRNAEARGDARALAELIELLTLHPEMDPKRSATELVRRAEALKSPETEYVVVRWYRQNMGDDGRYAQELVRICGQAKERISECYIDLARHYRDIDNGDELRKLGEEALRRQGAGEIPAETVQRLAWMIATDDIGGEPQPELAHKMLKSASEQSMLARVRLARLLIEYPHLDPEAKPEQLLLSAVSKGYPEAALALGRLYMGRGNVPVDPERAQYYLRQAAAALPAANYHLGKIYKRGDLGRADPVAAARHFLLAARGGYVRADLALAELFSDARGVKVNLPNAFSFAKIAARNKVPNADALLLQIQTAMSSQDRDQGENVMNKELQVRAEVFDTAAAEMSNRSSPEGAP